MDGYGRRLEVAVGVICPGAVSQVACIQIEKNLQPATLFEVFSDVMMWVTNDRYVHIPGVLGFCGQRMGFAGNPVDFTSRSSDLCEYAGLLEAS